MTRKTLIALGVLGVLLAITLVVELRPETPQEIAWSIPKLSDTVDRIEITRKGETLVLEKKGETWAITQPKVYEVSKSTLDAMLELFDQRIGMDLKVTIADDKEAERFELKGDKAITLKLSVGGKAVTEFIIGKSVGSRTFLQPAGEKVAYRAKASLRWKLDKDLADWREKKVADVSKEQIVRLRIQAGDGPAFEIEKEGDKWAITKPAAMPADGATVTALLSALASARAATFADDVKAEDAGFDANSYRLTVWAKVAPPEGAAPAADAPLTEITVELGGEVGKERLEGKYEKDVFLRKAGHPQIYVVRSYTVKNLRKKLSELRDRAVISLDQSQIVGLTLEGPGRKLVFERTGEDWDASEPAELAGKVDPSQMRSLVGTLATLKADEVLGAQVTPESVGLTADAPAAGRIEIRQKAGEPIVLLLGTPTDSKPPHLPVRLANGTSVFLLSDYNAKKLQRKTSAYEKVEGAPAGGAAMPPMPGMMPPGMMPPGMMPPGMMPPGGAPGGR